MLDDDEANFVRKLKRGQGKYKGKLPFKCFKCGRVGHFVSKCTRVHPGIQKDIFDFWYTSLHSKTLLKFIGGLHSYCII